MNVLELNINLESEELILAHIELHEELYRDGITE